MLGLKSTKPLLILLALLFAKQSASMAQTSVKDDRVKEQSTLADDTKVKSKVTADKSASKSSVIPGKSKTELSAKQAEDLVRSRKEIKEWLALFAKAKKDHRKVGTPQIEVERDGANWMVHVYEQMPDHTATVNWYTVDPKTSKISTMF